MAHNAKTGFTLTEVMVVMVIISLMAAFALPNYTESVRKAYERDAINHLTAIYSANQIYRAQARDFWAGPGASATDINAALNLNIVSDRLTFTYTDTAGSDTFEARATLVENSVTIFVLRLNEASLSTTNPCCESGSCHIAPAC